jgi:hypothetical protein
MPMTLEGSCQCGAVRFTVQSHTPVPYQRCYCSICRKNSSGGYAVNLGALADTLSVENWEALGLYHAVHDDGDMSVAERYFCAACGTPLWLFDERWPDLVHPVATAIDTALPVPPKLTHIFLDDKPEWVELDAGTGDQTFDGGPELSLEDWHKANGVWVE